MSITNAFRLALRKASELVYDDSVTDFGLDPEDLNVQKAIEAVAGALGAGLRNLIINSLGTINQRGYSSGAATSGANQYTVDRWRVVVSGQNLSWSESEGVRTFTAPAGGFEQVIEGAAILTGNYVLNWEGTATATVNGTPRAKGEAFTLTGGSNATVRFTSGTVSKMQLEPGTVPTPFERRHPAVELALCQRYFLRYATSILGARNHNNNSQCEFGVQFPNRMFASPTLAATSLINAIERPGIATITPTSISVRTSNIDGVSFTATLPTSITDQQPFYYVQPVDFSAEL